MEFFDTEDFSIFDLVDVLHQFDLYEAAKAGANDFPC